MVEFARPRRLLAAPALAVHTEFRAQRMERRGRGGEESAPAALAAREAELERTLALLDALVGEFVDAEALQPRKVL